MLCDKNKSPHIIVATMGRLLDLIQRGRINIKSVNLSLFSSNT